jgi:hypothetical protein
MISLRRRLVIKTNRNDGTSHNVTHLPTGRGENEIYDTGSGKH